MPSEMQKVPKKNFFVVNDKLTLPDVIVLCVASSDCYWMNCVTLAVNMFWLKIKNIRLWQTRQTPASFNSAECTKQTRDKRIHVCLFSVSQKLLVIKKHLCCEILVCWFEQRGRNAMWSFVLITKIPWPYNFKTSPTFSKKGSTTAFLFESKNALVIKQDSGCQLWMLKIPRATMSAILHVYVARSTKTRWFKNFHLLDEST